MRSIFSPRLTRALPDTHNEHDRGRRGPFACMSGWFGQGTRLRISHSRCFSLQPMFGALEATLLTFVLIAQNRMAAAADNALRSIWALTRARRSNRLAFQLLQRHERRIVQQRP